MHLEIGAVFFGEKLDTPSQQVVDVAVCEDLKDYRGDDQVGRLKQKGIICLEHVDDGYECHLEGHRSQDNVQFYFKSLPLFLEKKLILECEEQADPLYFKDEEV